MSFPPQKEKGCETIEILKHLCQTLVNDVWQLTTWFNVAESVKEDENENIVKKELKV